MQNTDLLNALRVLQNASYGHVLKLMAADMGKEGAWNRNPYTLGLYNGVEVALALFEKRDPDLRATPPNGFLNTPEEYDE